MDRVAAILIASALCILCSNPLRAQTEPVIVEAETGALGSALTVNNQDGIQSITISSTVAGGNPTSTDRVATFSVAFPAAGSYELYARLRVGPATFSDDSFYYANGFGAKAVSADTSADGDWILANGLANPVGYTLPSDKVVGGGLAQSGVWKWVKLSAFDGGEPSVAVFNVTNDNLTQTFQIAGREDGLDIDKIAFGFQGVYYTVNDLNNGLPGSTVPPPPPYIPPGPPIATGQSKFLGSAFSTSQATNFTAYWNQVTPENGGKWGSVEATRDVMNWADLDAAYNIAKTNGFPFKMHTLIWGAQQPAWIETLSPEEQLAEIDEWYAEVAARYPDLDFLDVVNEPLHDPPNQAGNGGGNYIGALGGTGTTGWDWVLNSFRMARAHFPNAKLLINEYSVTNNATDMQRYIDIIKLLQAEHLIDGVGVQGHAFETRPNVPMETQAANLNLLASTGLPIYISELDIDGPTDEVQLADFKRIFPFFWEHPSVKGITLWGYRPGHWRTAQGAYIVLENGAERPAMVWLQNYVKDHAPVVKAHQFLNIDGSVAPSDVIGTVRATDVDPGPTFSEWKIVGGNDSGVFAIDAATGALHAANPLAADFRRQSYPLSITVNDGYRTSAPTVVAVRIPEIVRICYREHTAIVFKLLVPPLLKHGARLGLCRERH